MVEEVERAQARLDHIRTVEPILGALRTISLGSWKAALKRSTGVQAYGERLTAILSVLVPHLPAKRRVGLAERLSQLLHFSSSPARSKEDGRQVAILVIGSERGLCGRFNTAVVERAEQYLDEQEAAGEQVELWALGSRVRRLLSRRHRPPVWWDTLSLAALPSSRLAFDLTRQWLARYEEGELDAVDVVYNVYRGTGRYQPTVVHLIPSELSPDGQSAQGDPWPPVIIETDPLRLYARLVRQWAAVRLYGLLLDSAAAEHSTRYQLMESASQNAERLISELTLVVQTGRQKEITQEMQELAAGAGLIGPQR